MNKRFSILLTALILTVSLLVTPSVTSLAEVADGTYNVPYEMKESRSDNTSIADGYFQSPAKVTVNGDQATVQFTVTGVDMLQSVKVPGSSISIVAEDEETRTYRLDTSVENLKNPVEMGMHIIVPDLYDTEHTARAVFDLSSIPAATATTSNAEETGAASEGQVENPQTGDRTPMTMYVVLLIGSVLIFTVYRIRLAKN